HRRRTVSLSYYSLFSSSSYCDHRDLHSFLHDALPICLPGIPGRRPSHAAFDGSCAMKKISHFTSADWRRTTRALLTVLAVGILLDRKSTRLNSSHVKISYAVFCLKKKKNRHYVATNQS